MTTVKLDWTIAEMTPGLQRRARLLEKDIRAACTIDPEYETRLVYLCTCLPSTRALRYPDTARSGVRALAEFLTRWQECTPAEIWQFAENEISFALMNNWIEAFHSAQDLFDPDPAELPESELNPQQKEEAAQPGTPLTSPAASLPSR